MFDIYYANLSKNTTESEQSGIRPIIIIQNDIGNKYSPTVLAIPITSFQKKVDLPTHCILHKTEKNGLKVDSMVMAEQIRVIDKKRILDKIGYVDDEFAQNDIINAYMANITGKKKYDSWWSKIIYMICKLVREGACRNAA